MTDTDPTRSLRRSAYLILAAVALAICAAKVVGAELVYEPSRYKAPRPGSFGSDRPADQQPEREWPKERPEPTPMFSSNDKSRWATVRALVENGSYVIATRRNFRDTTPPFHDEGVIVNAAGKLDSLDVVMNPETGEFFSSKPPLFPTIVAGGYWLLKKCLGWSLDHDRWLVVCTVLLTVNILPFAAYLGLLARLIEDYGRSDFGRLFTFAAACFGTFFTTFSVTLNNHTPAICCVLFASYPLLRRRAGESSESALELVLSGFFAGLLVTFEFPAAAFAAGLGVPLLVARPKRTLIYFLTALLVPVAALFACNYLALGRLLPAYSDLGRPGSWYDFPGSYWSKLKEPGPHRGIDFADEPRQVYLFHMLFGHHGWFSLTPVWLLGFVSMCVAAARAWPDFRRLFARPFGGRVWCLRLFQAMSLAVSVVVFAFFVYKTNNYGGFTSGLRWVFWLTTLWLLATLPAADRLASYRFGQWLALVLLGFSVLSVFYPAWNPWRPPWILQLCERTGWAGYGP
jgi:hypothetical protein